ncbi:MAG: hypothetical protein HQL86_05240 [Magnetococcales bacterium]|nr:hypothetical protein [Magnetococcales bacterium]
MKKELPMLLLSVALLLGCETLNAATLLTNRGSDTFLHLAQAWASRYHALQPAVSLDLRGAAPVPASPP